MSAPASPRRASCPVCDATVAVDAAVVASELVRCRDCGSDLEVTSFDPLQLVEAPPEEEDWGE